MGPNTDALGKPNWAKRACAVFVLCAATAIATPGQTITTLHSFDGGDGIYPLSAVVQATDGNLYGVTRTGAHDDGGTVFKISPSGTLTTLYDFCSQTGCADGQNPLMEGLVEATDGNFYGTTGLGGAYTCTLFGESLGCGTVFKITPSGTLTTLHSFDGSDGAYPIAGLGLATSGKLYGITTYDGAHGGGTIFEITLKGTLTTLYNFCSKANCTDGESPWAGLVQATDGNFYGTTVSGGANGQGTVFKITARGKLTTLHSFDGADGGDPEAGLIQATDGNFYGTTYGGGAYGGGTVFKMSPSGTLTTLYNFCTQSGCADGEYPIGGLVEATDGNYYGTTDSGGSSSCGGSGCGTVFEITPRGALTTLYSGEEELGFFAALVQDTNGQFYGTTQGGGAYSVGTVFSLSVGLGPFVETQPTSGKVGTAVKILGTNLTGATSVSFNGTAATFKVVSSSEITTKVPVGASTGTVQVALPGGTLSSNVPFRVP